MSRNECDKIPEDSASSSSLSGSTDDNGFEEQSGSFEQSLTSLDDKNNDSSDILRKDQFPDDTHFSSNSSWSNEESAHLTEDGKSSKSGSGTKEYSDDKSCQETFPCALIEMLSVKGSEGDIEFMTPEELLRVQSLIEYYLSDENLSKDMFLLKHVLKHNSGYVSLKLLSNYKKVKKVSRSLKHVQMAIESSNLLELSEDGSKVRRKSVLPDELNLDTPRPFRCILVYDIPEEINSMNKLAEKFANFGEINALQFHKPGGKNLQDVKTIERYIPGVSETVCAIIEYETVHSAFRAVKAFSSYENSFPKVVEMPRPQQSKMLNYQINIGNENCYSTSEMDECPTPCMRKRSKKFNSAGSMSSAYGSQSASSSCHSTGSSPFPHVRSARKKNDFASSSSADEKLPKIHKNCRCARELVPEWLNLNRQNFKSSMHDNTSDSVTSQSSCFKYHCSDCKLISSVKLQPTHPHVALTHSSPNSPCPYRRIIDSNKATPTPPNSPLLICERHRQAGRAEGNIIRHPKGPDGTKGFKAVTTTTVETFSKELKCNESC